MLGISSAGAASVPARSCRNVVVSFTFGGTTTASRVRVSAITCSTASAKVIVPCLYGHKPSGWKASRAGNRVTFTRRRAHAATQRVAYTTNARGGCVRRP
jgi:hypothetical protein